MLPAGAQRYRITVIGNAPGEPRVPESARPPGATQLGDAAARPANIRAVSFSLSHVALPFPPSDSLYGTDPDDEDLACISAARRRAANAAR